MLRVMTAFFFGSNDYFDVLGLLGPWQLPDPNTEILLILELRIIHRVVYNQLYDGRFLIAGYYSGTFCQEPVTS